MHLERKLSRIACRKDVFKLARTLLFGKKQSIYSRSRFSSFCLPPPPHPSLHTHSLFLSPLPCTLQHTFKEPVRKRKKKKERKRNEERSGGGAKCFSIISPLSCHKYGGSEQNVCLCSENEAWIRMERMERRRGQKTTARWCWHSLRCFQLFVICSREKELVHSHQTERVRAGQ